MTVPRPTDCPNCGGRLIERPDTVGRVLEDSDANGWVWVQLIPRNMIAWSCEGCDQTFYSKIDNRETEE